jgi:transcriptional regulator with XRE-family HTH domain
MSVGKELKRAREEAGLSQEELARKAEVSRVYLSEVERDRKLISLAVFMKICRGIGLLPSEVLARIEKRHRR